MVFGTFRYVPVCTEYILVRFAENGTYQYVLVCTQYVLSVLRSHFAPASPACIGVHKQLLSKSEKRFVRTHWVVGLSEVL
jgi:hypothetical protein